MTHVESLWCTECGDETRFEVPPCEDGHDDGDCPDLACVVCGCAVVRWVVADLPTSPTALSAAA